jgi:hypothetical protein
MKSLIGGAKKAAAFEVAAAAEAAKADAVPSSETSNPVGGQA